MVERSLPAARQRAGQAEGTSLGSASRQQRDQPNNQEQDEAHLRDGGGGTREGTEAEHGCDDGDNKEYQGPVEHIVVGLISPATPIAPSVPKLVRRLCQRPRQNHITSSSATYTTRNPIPPPSHFAFPQIGRNAKRGTRDAACTTLVSVGGRGS